MPIACTYAINSSLGGVFCARNWSKMALPSRAVPGPATELGSKSPVTCSAFAVLEPTTTAVIFCMFQWFELGENRSVGRGETG